MTALLWWALACAGVPVQAPSTPVETTMELEYRQIGRGISCIGNWRVKVTADGTLLHARNTEDCDRGEVWSAPLEPLRQLSESERAALWRLVEAEGILALDAHITDPKRATSDGSMEQVVVVHEGQEHAVEVVDTRVPAIDRLRSHLAGLIRR